MADAQASGACGSNIVWVQVPSPASFFVSNQIPPAMDFPGGFLLYFLMSFQLGQLLASQQDFRTACMLDIFFGNNHLADTVVFWYLIHDIQHILLQDGSQSPRPCMLLHSHI